jgi:transposase
MPNAWDNTDISRARGKRAKVALIAAMRKLLTAIFSVAKSKRPFVPHLTLKEMPA